MKRNFTHRSNVISILIMFSLSSCSWLASRKSLFGNDDPEKVLAERKKDQPIEMVPKQEFDKLSDKYDRLVEKTRYQNDQAFKKTVPNFEGKNPADIVNDLNKKSKSPELAETVDLFASKSKEILKAPTVKGAPILLDSDIENQIILLNRAEEKISTANYDEALTILKELEKSKVRQIRVRAKYFVGEMLFMQKDYDLSMQVFEEILGEEAFSGVVLKALGRLIVCSEKLKLKKKQDKYYSILHDFFESA